MAEIYRARGWKWDGGADFRWPAPDTRCLQGAQAFEALCRKEHAYFREHDKVAKMAGATRVEHLDLFLMRERAQKRALPELDGGRRDPRAEALRAFVDAQLDLFADTVRELAPTVVAVTNGTASKILRDRFVFRSGDECRSFRSDAFPASTFVFAGMVHGAHQMDVPSREHFVADLRLLLGTSALRLEPRLAHAA